MTKVILVTLGVNLALILLFVILICRKYRMLKASRVKQMRK